MKHCAPDSTVQICALLEQDDMLVIRIKNDCEPKALNRDWSKIAEPLFAFSRFTGSSKEKERAGIGFSTANALAMALKGSVSFLVNS